MVSFKILAGGYSAFVATYDFTITGDSASLRVISRSPTGANPSWLTYHPTNKSLVYAVNEVWPRGNVQSFNLKQDGSLSAPLDTVTSAGQSPAHIVALKSTGYVVVINYDGGNGRIFDTTASGTRFNGDGAQTITFPKPAVGVSHPHQVYEYNDEVWIPDLGADTIWRLVRNDDPTSKDFFRIRGSIGPQPQGGGPRHIAVHNDRLFVLHELSAVLSVQKIPPPNTNQVSIIDSKSIVPSDAPPNPLWAASEILIPAPSERFPVPYIYVSNRNKGPIKDPRGDTIAIFEHVEIGTAQEGLRLIRQVFTGLDLVRGMEFGPVGGDDEFLVAGASEGGAGVVVLQRVDGGKDLKIVARDNSIPTRTAFLWA